MIDYGFGVYLDTIEKAEMARDWRNDYTINCFFRQTGLISEKHHEKWLEDIESSNTRMFSIADIETDYYFGVCGLTSIDFIHRKAEISCYSVPHSSDNKKNEDHEYNAIKTITHFGFNELNINRIWAETFETHKNHLDILDYLGFKREAVLRESYYKNGRYLNSVIHSMLKKDWIF